MGYAGKVEERVRARELRTEGRRLADIAADLRVSKGTVSVWVRDVACPPIERRNRADRRPSRLHLERLERDRDALRWARERIQELHADAAFAAGIALYIGEGAKTGNAMIFVNTDERVIRFFLRWLRRYFDVDEAGLRCRLYLHEGLDESDAIGHWVAVTGIAAKQFARPYRAAANPSRREAKHVHGCLTIRLNSKVTLRKILALGDALLASEDFIPG